MSKNAPQFVPADVPADARIAIVASRFNDHLVSALLAGCEARLQQLGIAGDRVEVYRVPGAFELPVAAQALAQARCFAAIICLGAVVRGETPHFDYVAGQCAAGIQQVAVAAAMPVIFGVLTTDNEQQARDRLGGAHGHAGQRAAEAAAEMIVTLGRIRAAR